MQEIKIKTFSKKLTLVTAAITLVLGLYSFTRPYSAADFAVIFWHMSPYAFLAALINLTANKTAVRLALIISLSTCSFGLILLFNVVFIQPAVEEGLMHSIAPLWQWAGLIILTLPLILINKIQK
ncbi:hypothetical protein MNBD_GAMMA07-2508 [hydrothermal vent metagenome]|uniref:Uncharacterized protein n=1 Tax=hydrothermal vent metagenome TaxID=652676 RepID=A0A3B0XNR8_9ZZZZ